MSFGNLEKDNLEKKAFNLMKIIHGFQRRFSGEPYSEHPKGVVDIIFKFWQDKKNFEKINSSFGEKIAAVGYLHDSLEDTKLKPEWIKEIFGDDFLDILESLSEDKELRKSLEAKAKEEGLKKIWVKEKMLDDSLEKIDALVDDEGGDEKLEIAATIRIADIIQNMEDFEDVSPDLQERFLKKAEKIYLKFKDKIALSEVLGKRISELKNNN